ncbi:MAG: hypothetical protein J6J66_06815, partial [Clostridia bacterium]|nr:hypothetical protein [Clostridia bacterium]
MIEFSKLLYNLFSALFKPSFDSFLSFFILFQLFFAALKQVISTIIRTILPNLILPDLILPELPLFPFFVYYQPTFFAENPSMYFQTQIIAMIYFSQIVRITSIVPVSALHSSISAYLFRNDIPYSHPHIPFAAAHPIAIRISLAPTFSLYNDSFCIWRHFVYLATISVYDGVFSSFLLLFIHLRSDHFPLLPFFLSVIIFYTLAAAQGRCITLLFHGAYRPMHEAFSFPPRRGGTSRSCSAARTVRCTKRSPFRHAGEVHHALVPRRVP